jgi:hypothetical protein
LWNVPLACLKEHSVGASHGSGVSAGPVPGTSAPKRPPPPPPMFAPTPASAALPPDPYRALNVASPKAHGPADGNFETLEIELPCGDKTDGSGMDAAAAVVVAPGREGPSLMESGEPASKSAGQVGKRKKKRPGIVTRPGGAASTEERVTENGVICIGVAGVAATEEESGWAADDVVSSADEAGLPSRGGSEAAESSVAVGGGAPAMNAAGAFAPLPMPDAK